MAEATKYDELGAAIDMASSAAAQENAAEGSDNASADASASAAMADGEAKPEGLSKNALKKMLKGKDKKKKEPIKVEANPEKKEKKEKRKKEKEPEKIFEDDTPAGEKKHLTEEFPATYQPKYVEAAWQAWWEKTGFYSPDVEAAKNAPADKKFVMVIPPPNVTGSLHLGHALTNSIEDTLTRWHRMRGDVTLWVPGTDHAGIATQTVVEKKLKRDEGLTRHALGRDEFVKRVWEWKEQYGNRITSQIRHLGASVDWSREAFTMDDKLSRAVNEAFCRFHEDGLLYRARRLVNWSCALKSAISDIEVDFIELEGRTMLSVPNHTRDKYEFGTLTSFAYKLEDSDEEIVVATTRLETMLGDTAVAVHPDDPRYKHLHGKFVVHPFVDRKIPIVCDPVLVDMSFGTGAVKITPAHDPNDYECGMRHNLPFITILTEDGRINANGGKFEGQMRYDARIAVEKALEELGLLRGKENNKMRLGLCSRSKDIIEPLLTPQWYVNCKPMAERAIAAVRNGELKIVPEFHEQTWYRWLEDIRDWCISRQLWWGHRIPAYFAQTQAEKATGTMDKTDMANNDRWIVARTEELARQKAAELLGVPVDQVVLDQDEDVLDTWFSSGLFPFSVFGWPENTADLEAFYPTSLLETGMDILFFWVARMVMMGLHLTNLLPFHTVYLHAMVRDKYGRKMSKSLGNVIDPMEVIYGCNLEALHQKLLDGNLPEHEIEKAREGQRLDFPNGIPECGADALRFGLLAYTVQGRDINLDIQRVVGYRQFCNKLWNAVRFALTYVTDFQPSVDTYRALTSLPGISKRDLFILHRLNTCINQCNTALSEYSFGPLTTALYEFWLYDLCDVYLELIKPVMNDSSEAGAAAKYAAQATLYTCIEFGLRLLHPVMPFVTEELWQRLPGRAQMVPPPPESIMVAPYPENVAEWDSPAVETDMKYVKEVIHATRSVRADYNITNNVRPPLFIKFKTEEIRNTLQAQLDDITTLARTGDISFLPDEEPVPAGCCVKVVNDQCSILMQLKGLIDIDAEITRLNKQREKVLPALEALQRKMAIPDYENKVPENVRESNAQKAQQYAVELASIDEAIANFESMR